MITEFKFKSRRTQFLGRNGSGHQTGVSVYGTTGATVIIEPITSKGTVGRCFIEIPKEDIPNFIDALAYKTF